MYEYNNMWDPNVVNALGLQQQQQQQYYQQPQYYPQQQQGGMINTGYGYNMFNNMPYYTGNYNMNNPYLVEQQRRQQYETQQQEIKKKDDFIYKLDNIARRALNQPEYFVPTEEEQRERLTPEQQMEQYEEYRMNADLAYIQVIDNERHMSVDKYVLHANSIARNLEQAKQALPENPSASDCLKRMSDQYIQMKEQEQKRNAFAKNYNSKGYGQLLQRDVRSGSYFDGVFGGLDNTVNFTTPDSEFLEHKKMFLELISRQL